MRRTICLTLPTLMLLIGGCGSDDEMTGPPPPPPPPPSGAPVMTILDNLAAGNGGVTVGPDGNIYMGDSGPTPGLGGNTVFQVTPTGTVTVFASGAPLNTALGGAWRSDGVFHQSSFNGNAVLQIAADGTVTTFVTDGIAGPVGLVFDDNDDLFVANCGTGSIQRVTPAGVSTQVAQNALLNCPNGLALDPNGDIYVSNFNDGNVLRVTQAGAVSVFATLPTGNLGHITFGNGLFYVAARGAHQIYTINTAGGTAVLVGSGVQGFNDGQGTAATLSLPNDVALSADGNTLYFNQVRSSAGGANNPSQLRAIDLSQN